MELQAQRLIIWIPPAIALLCVLIRAAKGSFRRGQQLPPGPRPLPVVGNLLDIGDKPHRSLARLAKAYGPLMSVRLGHVTTVVISSPDVAREVLHKKDQAFCARSVPDAARALGTHEASVVWLPAGERWRGLRRICSTELFVTQRLNDSQPLRRRKARELVAYVRGAAGEPVDVGRAAFTTMLNLISNTLFSIDMVDPSSELGRDFKDLVWAVMEESGCPNVSDFFPVLAAVDLQDRRRRVAAYLTRLHEIFDELIEGRMQAMAADDSDTHDFLDSLIRCHTHDDVELDRHVMKILLGDLFIAGTDTSSHTVEWAMAELLRNPSSMAAAQAELTEAIGVEKEVDESDIQRLPYLQAVVKETLRLHPPTPLLLPRRAETSVQLCGYTVPEGARVLVNVWAIGRDGDVWTDPDRFAPERFLGREVTYRGRDLELIPFGAGRRMCPGLPLAFRMVHLMLASLLHSFKWKLPDGMAAVDVDMDEKFGLTLAKAVPLQAVPILNGF